MLRFFGRGSGFSDEHNGAYFTVGSQLILVDCPLVTFKRLKNDGLEYYYNKLILDYIWYFLLYFLNYQLYY